MIRRNIVRISAQEVRLVSQLKTDEGTWRSIAELAALADVGRYCCRERLTWLVGQGIVERMEVHPCHLYRLAGPPSRQATEYFELIKTAGEYHSRQHYPATLWSDDEDAQG